MSFIRLVTKIQYCNTIKHIRLRQVVTLALVQTLLYLVFTFWLINIPCWRYFLFYYYVPQMQSDILRINEYVMLRVLNVQ